MRFVFGDIVVDAEQIKLTKHAKQIEFEPRVFELLVFFCKHPQEAISREELVEQVWGGRIVSDAAINRAVGELRKLLEDNPSSPQWIKTVSKVGYRLAVIPTLEEDHDLAHKEQPRIAEPETTPVEPLIVDVKQLQVTNNNSAPISTLNGKWILLIAVLALFIIFVYKTLFTQNPSETFGVVGRQPVTSTMGNAFNGFYDAKTNTLLFLYRADADASAQIHMKKAMGPAQVISNDDYYYTDVLYGTDGFIYASRLNNLQQRHCEIVQIEPATKRFTPIMDCGKRVVTKLVFDDKKRRLIYKSRPSISEPYSIHSYQLDTGRKQQITHPVQAGNNAGDYVFAISEDSQTLAVVEYNGDEVDKIKIVDLNDNSIMASAPFIDHVYGLVWRDDNKILASNSDGLFEFNVNNLSLILKENSDQFGGISQGYDNRSILTERSQTTINIFSYSKDQAGIKPLTKNSGINLTPMLGNRSDVLAFKSDRTGEEQIYIQAADETTVVAKFNESIDYISGIAWSPKDDKLVASINNALYLYSLESQQWQKIAATFTQVHQVAYVEETIMFSAEVDGQWNIWQLSLANEQVKQITTKGGYSVQGNNKKVYFTKFNHDGLYQLDLKTGIESVIIKGFPISGWRHWQLRDNKIYYLLDKSYMELNLDNSIEQVVHTFEGRTPNSCHTSYKHDFFACEQVEFNSSNIWQIQLLP
ncbi:winged helix-turn-helix domain-containing protein [Colwellia sp. BRX10-3]|uniref:winged helix-turn-helix domain-containing protein n=1 Tax=Colwellia sp. BRX10-3 TaxID=2759844 RepID=UPI0015F64BE6|nr:winged helix-turn-helix domain-containing protein [Colwellia sp. BRX10-3]MBA6391013.1 winged helix-turn-helix domain-containing protein [Colwellia sp. BRX10-3]